MNVNKFSMYELANEPLTSNNYEWYQTLKHTDVGII